MTRVVVLVKPCILVNAYWRFGGTHCFNSSTDGNRIRAVCYFRSVCAISATQSKSKSAVQPPSTLSPSFKVIYLVWLLKFVSAWLTAVSARHGTVCPHPAPHRSIRENLEWPICPESWHGFGPPPLQFILTVRYFEAAGEYEIRALEHEWVWWHLFTLLDM